MFRLRRVSTFLHRLLHGGAVGPDQVLEHLQVCCTEDQVFEVVARNKAKLNVEHVSSAVKVLWELEKIKPQITRTVDVTRRHPQFLTLQVLAENNISYMDDSTLVETLYNFLRLNVEPHDSLVQQLVSEAWLRIDGFSMVSLSKFANCLTDQHLYHSPLMGHIAHILDQRLSSIDDARILTTLMTSVSFMVSPRLRDALLQKADELVDTIDVANDYNSLRRLVQFMRNIKYTHRPLLEKCNKMILHTIPRLDTNDIKIIMSFYQSLQFSNYDFRMAMKERLKELLETSTEAASFTKVFVALGHMADPKTTKRLEYTALLLADELTAQQAAVMAEGLEGMCSKNVTLMNKIASIIQTNVHVYKQVEVVRVTRAFCLMQYKNPELFSKLRSALVNFLQRCISPHEVISLTRLLSMMPSVRVEDAVISRVEAVVTQCNLNDLSTLAVCVAKWIRNDNSYCRNTPSRYMQLLQKINQCSHEQLQATNRLDVVLEEFKNIKSGWFQEVLVDEALLVLQRMMDQMNCTNIAEMGLFLTRISHLCPPLMDRIASVAIKDIEKIHCFEIYALLLPFSILNYDPGQAGDLYGVCIQQLIPNIRSLDPHLLVLLAYTLVMANRFPEEFIREIFSIDFLGRLDTQLETLPVAPRRRTRLRLMEVNRAVCLEYPEFQVPWFHDRYCQQLQKKGDGVISRALQQIHKMLGEVLGGINHVRVGAVTPYYYTVDFECILDRHMRPLAFSEHSSLVQVGDELPPGAQRVAVEFLNSRLFCRNSHHIKGDALMKKRHLEMLGYRVVQIPQFEWNSMELSTEDAWKEYLKSKIFKEP